jgi:hypothetical protein
MQPRAKSRRLPPVCLPVLNQRSQRRSYTWAADTELMRLLALEQPRIVPRAKQSL